VEGDAMLEEDAILDEQEAIAALSESMEREAERRTYPIGFPALPEIPGGRYVDDSFFQLEMKHLWRKIWLYAMHISEVPEIGSYKIFDKLGLSIIVTHGQDGKVRAFHNVCRHRGAALVTENTGKKRQIVCPYHAWSYTLEGRLATVPQEYNFACLDRSERGLIAVRCEIWRGFIFLNLDNSAISLQEYLTPIAKRLEDFPLEQLVVKRTSTLQINCNWKAAADNFIEVYHVPVVHRKTVMNWLRPETVLVSFFNHGHSWITTKRTGGNRIAGDAAPKTPGAAELFKDHQMVVPIFPNLHGGGFDPGGFPMLNFWPGNGPNNTIMEIPLFGWGGESENVEYWDKLMADILSITSEDMHILTNIQKSLSAGYFTGVLLSYHERAIYWFNEELDRVIGAENIPVHLRVQQVLGPYSKN
jgi:choline monooxygenase